MIKKEISEIKKQFTHQNTSITKIVGCYVGSEKEKIATLSETFLCLPEEETFKYFEIFAKTLSGTLGKNLINMDFPTDSEFGNGTQKFLFDLRKSGLKDEELVDKFFDKVISSFDYVGNYLVLLVHANYDIPGETSDELGMEDASEEVYEYILCAICPVELDEAGLSFDAATKRFSARERDWVIDKPINGFLFPAFNDRSADVHAALYYTKKAEEINQSFIDEVLGTEKTLTAGTQKESFRELIEDSLEEACEFDVVRTIHEKISEVVELSKEEPAPVIFDKKEVTKVLEDSGVSEESIVRFEKKYDEKIGADALLQATNIVDTRAIKVKTSNIEIKCSPENADLLETKIIDGKRCIVIPLDNNVEVNGIPVTAGKLNKPSE